jgi:hypothetical protein
MRVIKAVFYVWWKEKADTLPTLQDAKEKNLNAYWLSIMGRGNK